MSREKDLQQIVSELLTKLVKDDIKTRGLLTPVYNNVSISKSRSRAITVPATYNGKSVFMKITPEFGTTNPIGLKSMAQAEVEIYKVTSNAMKKGLTDHFVEEYNTEILNSSTGQTKTPLITTINNRRVSTNTFTLSILEKLSYETFDAFLKSKDKSPKNQIIVFTLILQLLHTLYLLHFLGIKHMDLHFGNILVVKTPTELRGKFNEYRISKGNSAQDKFKSLTFWLPITGYSIKIIDYDGSLKFQRKFAENNYKNFEERVTNPYIIENYFSNPTNTHATNMFKIFGHFQRNHPEHNYLKRVSSKFFSNKFTRDMLRTHYRGTSEEEKLSLTFYFLLRNKKMRNIPLDIPHVWTILKEIQKQKSFFAMKIFTKPKKEDINKVYDTRYFRSLVNDYRKKKMDDNNGSNNVNSNSSRYNQRANKIMRRMRQQRGDVTRQERTSNLNRDVRYLVRGVGDMRI